MSTTKLTRKEILSEDPVHVWLIKLTEFVRERGLLIAVGGLGAAVLAVGIYFAVQYLEARDMRTQAQLAKAMAFYHAQVDPAAPDDPYGKGPTPQFRTSEAKLQATTRALQDTIAQTGSSNLGVIARYYLGLTQLKQGQNKEALQTLEEVRRNTKNLTVGYLAKKVLAKQYFEAGKYKEAQEILDGAVRDPQCSLPREDLKLQLAKVYAAEGKRDQAIKILREAKEEAPESTFQSAINDELTALERAPSSPVEGAKP